MLFPTSVYTGLIVLYCLLFQCSESPNGKELATTYCTSCHKLPKPGELDQSTWQNIVLPRMGAMMGVQGYEQERLSLFETGYAGEIVRNNNKFPEKSQITLNEWKAVMSYYSDNAPEQLELNNKQSIAFLGAFQILFPSLLLSPPSTSFVNIDHGIHTFADINKSTLIQLDHHWKAVHSNTLISEGLVDIDTLEEHLIGTFLGSFSPTDAARGSIQILNQGVEDEPPSLIGKLQRPTQNQFVDLNQDGNEEMIISEYGKWTGRLGIWSEQGGSYDLKTVLSKTSGCLQTECIDIDKDGDLDIIALFGQGNEGFKLYLNNGYLDFTERLMLQLPPTMGSVGFSLFDVDQDNQLEIIYYAGDQADYNPINKPNQGIYVYEIENDLSLTKSIFWPFQGCYKVIHLDIDGVAPMDFAAISYFPNFNEDQPLDFLQIIRNKENTNLLYSSLSQHGRWLVMDSGDFDNDGDEDLILGSLIMEVPGRSDLVKSWISNGLPYIILRNQLAVNTD